MCVSTFDTRAPAQHIHITSDLWANILAATTATLRRDTQSQFPAHNCRIIHPNILGAKQSQYLFGERAHSTRSGRRLMGDADADVCHPENVRHIWCAISACVFIVSARARREGDSFYTCVCVCVGYNAVLEAVCASSLTRRDRFSTLNVHVCDMWWPHCK